MLMPEAPASKLVRAIGRWSLGALVVNVAVVLYLLSRRAHLQQYG